MAQQHRGPHGQESQQRSGWRERFFGDRNEDDRNRESESDWEEQGGRRGVSGYSRDESEQSGWEEPMRTAGVKAVSRVGISKGSHPGAATPTVAVSSKVTAALADTSRAAMDDRATGSVNRAAMAAAGPTSAKGSAANSNAATGNLANRVALALHSGARKNPPGNGRATDGSTNRSHSTSRIRRVFRASPDHRKARDTALVARVIPSTAHIAARAPRATFGLTTA